MLLVTAVALTTVEGVGAMAPEVALTAEEAAAMQVGAVIAGAEAAAAVVVMVVDIRDGSRINESLLIILSQSFGFNVRQRMEKEDDRRGAKERRDSQRRSGSDEVFRVAAGVLMRDM
jgi:hypothetical protein